MLYQISSLTDHYLDLIKDDPVRPEIAAADRVNQNSRVYLWLDQQQVGACVCVKFLDFVPTEVDHLSQVCHKPTTAVFYTIWSYRSGSARLLLMETARQICEEMEQIQTLVTLSPKTDMARKFHLANGALELQENPNTVNYVYRTPG